MKKISVAVILLGLLGASIFWAAGFFSPTAAVDYFEDKTPGSGLDFTCRNGEEADHYTMLETLGGGVGLLDYDRDGLLDIFVTGGGHFGSSDAIQGYPNRLFRNEGDWRFRDVTAEAGLPTEGGFYSHGCAVGDFNNDGWPDMLVTGYGRLALYQNQKGKFVDVTQAAGLADRREQHWSTSAAWGDLTGDGHLDLFVCHYVNWSFLNHPVCNSHVRGVRDVCSPKKFTSLPQQLFINQGNGTFKETGAEAGIVSAKGLGVLMFDADNDGKLDIYVASDTTGNFLYLNKSGGKFEESALLRGIAYAAGGHQNGSMGVTGGDYTRTGCPSIFVTNFQEEYHALYRNLGDGQFQNSEVAAGLVASLGRFNVGWGTGFVDFDLDGSEDLFICHGHAERTPKPPGTAKQRASLLRNLYQRGEIASLVRFENVTERGGPYFRTEHMGRGVAFGDLDNDGGIDIVVSHNNEPVALLRNQYPKRGHWLGVALTGKPSPEAIGAKLTLEVDGQTLTRFVLGGGSYLSSSDRRVVFGLGKAQAVEKLTVRWPSGRTQSWEGKDLPVDGYVKLVEGEAAVTR